MNSSRSASDDVSRKKYNVNLLKQFHSNEEQNMENTEPSNGVAPSLPQNAVDKAAQS